MKILKIFSVVVGIHVFALVLIFANPGCSSPNKPAPSPSDTASPSTTPSNESPRASSDRVAPVIIADGDSPVSSVPSSFDPNAEAVPAIRFSPTRPGTPVANNLETAPVGDVIPASTYAVAKGDSLWTIAKKHQITVAELSAANNIRANSPIRLGQKLIIPGKLPNGHSGVPDRSSTAAVNTPAPAPTAAPAPRGSAESVKHVIRPGETLGAIARKYQVKVGEIALANNISDPAKIRPGQELIIPGWKAPTAKSNRPAPAPAATSRPPEVERPVENTPSPIEAAPVGSAPSLVIPAPEGSAAEPPVIRVDEKP